MSGGVQTGELGCLLGGCPGVCVSGCVCVSRGVHTPWTQRQTPMLTSIVYYYLPPSNTLLQYTCVMSELIALCVLQ